MLLFNGFSQWPLQNPLVWYLVEICRHQVCFTTKSSLLGANLLICQILGDFGRSTCSRKHEPVYNGQQNVQPPKLGILYYIYNFLYDICKYIIKDKSILITVIIYIYTQSYLHVCKEKQIERERESWLEVPFVFYGCTGLASKPCQPLALALGAAYQGACKPACLWENNHHLSVSLSLSIYIYICMCVYLIIT